MASVCWAKILKGRTAQCQHRGAECCALAWNQRRRSRHPKERGCVHQTQARGTVTVAVGTNLTVEEPSESRMRENHLSGLMRGGARRSLALGLSPLRLRLLYSVPPEASSWKKQLKPRKTRKTRKENPLGQRVSLPAG